MNNEAMGADSKLMDEVLYIHRHLTAYAADGIAIPDVLERIGKAAKVDRVYVFQFRSDRRNTILASQRFEWSVSDVASQLDNPALQDVPMRDAGYGRWIDYFLAYRPVAGAIASFPHEEREILRAQDILSLVAVPIYVDSLLWGFAGFDDCTSSREWSDAEVDLLLSLAISLGVILLRQNHRTDRSSNTSVATYAAIAGGLLWGEGLVSLDATRERFSSRAVEHRIRSLVRSHQFLQSRSDDRLTELEPFLTSLQDHFQLITRERGISVSVLPAIGNSAPIPSETAPGLAMLVSERLNSLSTAEGNRLDRLTISVERDSHRAHLVITGYGPEGDRVPLKLSGSFASLLLARRLLSQMAISVRPQLDPSVFPVATVGTV